MFEHINWWALGLGTSLWILNWIIWHIFHILVVSLGADGVKYNIIQLLLTVGSIFTILYSLFGITIASIITILFLLYYIFDRFKNEIWEWRLW